MKIHHPTAIPTKLKRIEGQVRGILNMIEEGRYCIDVLTQIGAVRAALHRVEHDVLKNHVSCCVVDAFKKGTVNEQRVKVEELVKTLTRLTK